MRIIPVSEVRVNHAGRLLVVPNLPPNEDFSFIFRAAKGVTWDAQARALVSPTPRCNSWTHLDWFRHIVIAVAEEYGARLSVSPHTKWQASEALRREIENLEESS